MSRRSVVAVFFLTGLLAGSSLRADTLSVRLVKASDTAERVDSRLDDILPALTHSLVFKAYTLVATATLELPAAGQEVKLGFYRIRCTGPAENLSIQIRHDDTPLLYTTVSLKEGKPVVLGGFPAADGRMIIVFVLQR
ncbi:MAG: hypothetical protein N2255_04850 [Kiritimatiellae bacterium]|nr:hypothetical protein [Kiritimatiellia bacterium]